VVELAGCWKRLAIENPFREANIFFECPIKSLWSPKIIYRDSWIKDLPLNIEVIVSNCFSITGKYTNTYLQHQISVLNHHGICF